MNMPDSIISAVAGEELKYCPKCKTLKPYSEFHKNKAAKDGLQPICKKCRSEADKIRNDKIRELKRFSSNLQTTSPEVIKTVDGRTLIKKETSDSKTLDQYTPREILAELKRRGYVWTEMWVKQTIDYDKI